MNTARLEDMRAIAKISGLSNFTGDYRSLGGGEMNDTFVLVNGTNEVVVRIAKDASKNTLIFEARALKLLGIPRAPRLVFYDEQQTIHDRHWIVETYLFGSSVDHLTIAQYKSLGSLLGQVHTATVQTKEGANIWGMFLHDCRSFGNENLFLNHPDARLGDIIRRAYSYFQTQQPLYNNVRLSLIHGDATPSNVLARGNEISLIDWEFAKFSDPMAEFSTVFYDDIEYNQGKWRSKITKAERTALFDGYRSAGGVIDEDRVKLWMNHDKLGAAVFLYWRISQSTREIDAEQLNQYKFDLHNLLSSLEKNL